MYLSLLLPGKAWIIPGKDWVTRINTKLRAEIDKIIANFREQVANIVLYYKYDYTNYEMFVDISRKADYVFTTAKEKVKDYISYCNHDRVYALEFGFNPIYNNPVGMKHDQKLDGAIFAGSWYEKYPHRQKDTMTLF